MQENNNIPNEFGTEDGNQETNPNIITPVFEFDKYGRLLVNVYNLVDKKSVNDMMVEEGFGKMYDGGTKDTNWA